MFVAAIVLLYLGGANSFIARYAGTCMMGSADEQFGIWLSIILYGLALFCVFRSTPSRAGLIALAPLLAPLWMQVDFAARFGFAYFVRGISICSFLGQWMPIEYDHDGREFQIWLLWTITSVLAILVITVSIRKAFR